MATKSQPLSLDSPQWRELQHAYGDAEGIPDLLRDLEETLGSGEDEPWFSLWSALAHQGDVYPASFAAVPHVIAILARHPETADSSCFQFPAWVEICRHRKGLTVSAELVGAYQDALSQLPAMVAAIADREWDEDMLTCCMAALAAAKGQHGVAEAALELIPQVAAEFMNWRMEQ